VKAVDSATERDVMQIGIIGFGRFGRLVAQLIRANFGDVRILVFARKKEPGVSEGFEFATLEEVCGSDVVIPCVSISSFEEVISSICGKIKPGALLIDVCSVKVYPVQVMMKYIPDSIEILATHPVFGPDSASPGLKELKVIMHGVRISSAKFDRIKRRCRDIGLVVIEMTPEEHDRLMAYSLAYTHLIGRIGERIGVKSTDIDPSGFAQLLKVQGYVVNDTLTLFRDMHNYNPYAREMRQQVQLALTEIEETLTF